MLEKEVPQGGFCPLCGFQGYFRLIRVVTVIAIGVANRIMNVIFISASSPPNVDSGSAPNRAGSVLDAVRTSNTTYRGSNSKWDSAGLDNNSQFIVGEGSFSGGSC